MLKKSNLKKILSTLEKQHATSEGNSMPEDVSKSIQIQRQSSKNGTILPQNDTTNCNFESSNSRTDIFGLSQLNEMKEMQKLLASQMSQM